jgi:hypothetical protein
MTTEIVMLALGLVVGGVAVWLILKGRFKPLLISKCRGRS